MKYRIYLTERTMNQMTDAARWWAANRSTDAALRWHEGFLDRIDLLGDNPERFPLSREDETFPYEVRELHCGLGTRPSHRAVFIVRPEIGQVASRVAWRTRIKVVETRGKYS